MFKTIAVTGATGFTGGAIASHFLEQGWRVLAFGRQESISLKGNVVYRRWDIGHGTITVDEPVHVVVHCAAAVDDWGPYNRFYLTNVVGTRNVLDAFEKTGQFIFISSSSVYAPPATEKSKVREDSPYAYRYLNAYSRTKMLAEKIVMSRPRSVILRPRAIYGPGDRTILPRLMRAKRGPLLIGIGNGQNPMSITYIGNLVHAVERVVHSHIDRDIFNIADAKSVTLEALLGAVSEQMGWNTRVIFLPTLLAMSIAVVAEATHSLLALNQNPLINRYIVQQMTSAFTLDITKAQSKLDYDPPFDYWQGLKEIKKWLDSTC